MIKNIVFDIGKVLVSFEPYDVMRKMGFSEVAIQSIKKALFDAPVWLEGDRGVLSKKGTLEMYQKAVPGYEKEVLALYENVDQTIELMPYAMKWIADLKAEGYRVYIISNYAENTYEKTERKLQFLTEVDGAILSYQHKMLKPDREIYELLLDTYSLKAEECVFIDDLPENVQGAIDAGYQGIVFLSYEQAKKELNRLLN